MILDFIKNLFKGPDHEFEKITPEFLLKQKLKMGKEQYIKWLLKQATVCQAIISMRKEKNFPIPQMWIDKFQLIEAERDKVQKYPQ